jgi:hypothetical protein
MSSTANPPTLTLKEHFDNAIFVLCRGMDFAVLKGGVARAIFWVLNTHIRAIASRFNQALARGPIKPRKRPEPTTRREPTPKKPRALPKYLRGYIPAYFNGESLPHLGSAFGYAKAAMNHFCMVNNGIEHITYLFTLPDFIEAVETNPALGRILRPLCHMFAIKLPPCLQQPKRMRARPPAPTPDPKPEPKTTPKPQPVRKPRDGGFSLIGIHPERATGPLYPIPEPPIRKKPA